MQAHTALLMRELNTRVSTMRISGWRRGIGRLELAVRAKATGDEPLQIKRIEQRRSQIGLALMSCSTVAPHGAMVDDEFNMRV